MDEEPRTGDKRSIDAVGNDNEESEGKKLKLVGAPADADDMDDEANVKETVTTY